MICKQCNHDATSITNSRPTVNGWTYRRRECMNCGHRWNTYEIPEDEISQEEDEDGDNS
jgi:transcriptional regulator NrdR family protein